METQPQNQELAELKELDRRRAGALAITLWWVKGTQHTYVEVIDMDAVPPTVTEIPVLEGQKAAEVFNHPMYYADQNAA
jgi:hypothetical protein